ncbi:SGNH/GDSL hydrolase family protein [Cupriavidus basilensis]|uniref:SGNH/GDSL hydrolase family protein n=1 Tax=Cupriavidus basilensis TaxID=68895 RepID=UPI0039F67333
MSVESAVADLTIATTALLEQVSVKKVALDQSVAAAASSQVAAGQSAVAADGARQLSQAAAGTAQAARDAAVQVVTGGTAAPYPQAGKIPIADGFGRVPYSWVNTARFHQMVQNMRDRVVRVYHGGTSIENSGTSGTRQFLEAVARRFGDSGNETVLAGILGGSYDAAYSGWKKQPYGGILFTRLRGDSTATAFSLKRFCKRIVVRYSTEVDGGSFDVQVDGVVAATINCNGPQSYNNEVVLTYTGNEAREIKFMPPAAGYAYLETIDACQDNPGLHIIDATLGGSSINNMVKLRPPTGAQVAGVAIGANVAIDAMFAKNSASYTPDLAFVAWTVNDAGAGMPEFTNTYTPALQRIVQQAKAVGTQLILIIEMGGHYTMPNSPNHAVFDGIRALIHSLETEPHVTVIDWHAQSRPDDLPTWFAKYYPTAVLNYSTGTVTSGDGIHPVQAGHAIVTEMLCAASGVQAIGSIAPLAADVRSITNKATEVPGMTAAMSAAVMVPGIVRETKNALGMMQRYRAIGYSHFMAFPFKAKSTLWWSDTELDYSSSVNAQIAAAGTSDQYGAYKDFNNTGLYEVLPEISAAATTSVTLTLIVGPGAASIKVRNEANTADVDHWINGKNAGGVSLAQIPNNTGVPQVVHMTTKGGSRVYMVLTGRIYGAFSTPTDFPCIPVRALATARDIGPPMRVVGDLECDQVIPQQHYLETINGKTLEKICIGREVMKVSDSKFYGLYRLADRTGVDLQRLLLKNVASSTYDARFGGFKEFSNDATNMLTNGLAAAAIPYDKIYTLTGRFSNDSTGVKVYFYNGGSNRYLFLKPDMTWEEAAFGSGTPLITTSATRRAKIMAATFAMPSAALAVSGNWALNIIQFGGGTPGWFPWTLCEGSSAVV